MPTEAEVSCEGTEGSGEVRDRQGTCQWTQCDSVGTQCGGRLDRGARVVIQGPSYNEPPQAFQNEH